MSLVRSIVLTVLAPALTIAGERDEERLNVNWTPTVVEAQAFADSVVYDPSKKSKWDGAIKIELTCEQPFVSAGKWEPILLTPLCKVERMSLEAKQKYETLTLTEETLPFPGLEVVAYPPTGEGVGSSFGYQLVILKSSDRSVVVKPENMELVPVELSNRMGYKATLNSVVARFTPEQIARVQAGDRDGEFFVATVNDAGGERESKLKKKHFKLLR